MIAPPQYIGEDEEEEEEEKMLIQHALRVSREMGQHARQMAQYLQDRETFWDQVLLE